MITIGLCALVLLLLVSNVLTLRSFHLLREKTERMLSFNSDETLMAALETHAVSSTMAKRMLTAAHTEPPLSEDWRHSTNASTPPQEHWNIFMRDMALEEEDAGRLACLLRWLEGGNHFTLHERVEITSLFTASESRDAARRAFNTIQDKKPAAPKPDIQPKVVA